MSTDLGNPHSIQSQQISHTGRKKKVPGCLILLVVIIFLCVGITLFFKVSPFDIEEKINVPQSQVYGELTDGQKAKFDHLVNSSDREPEIYEESGVIRSVLLDVDMGYSNDPEMQVKSFMEEYQELYNIRDFSKEFVLKKSQKNETEDVVLKYTQIIDSIPVYSSGLSFGFSPQGKINIINGAYLTEDQLIYESKPVINKAAVTQILSDQGYVFPSEYPDIELVLYNETLFGQPDGSTILAWVTEVYSEDNIFHLVVSAIDGEILIKSSQIVFSNYGIWDMQNMTLEDFREYRNDGCKKIYDNPNNHIYDTIWQNEPDLEPKIEDLNFNIQKTLETYKFLLNWDGYDNKDSRFIVFLNLQANSPFHWTACGTTIIGFTDDASLKSAKDIFTHEFQHGVTNSRVKLEQTRLTAEAGALSEAYSDIFTTLVDTNEPWQLKMDSHLIRDMQKPKNVSGQVDHYRNFKTKVPLYCKIGDYDSCQEAENGYPHQNSTIFSHAAYLFAAGGKERGIEVHGVGIEDMAKIFFAGQNYMIDNSSFMEARNATLQACQYYYSETDIGKFRCDQLRNAFGIVGIGDPAPQPSFTEKLKEAINDLIRQVEVIREGLIEELYKKIEDLGMEIDDYRKKLEEDLFNLVMEMIINLLLGYFEKLMDQMINGFCSSMALVLIPALGIMIIRRKQ
jgi:thermolysin